MSPALSLKPIFPSARLRRPQKVNNIETSLRGEFSDQRTQVDVNMRRRELLKSAGPGLIGTGFSAVQPTKTEPESPQESTSSRMSYHRLLEYLNEAAKKVDLFENSTVAIAGISNPTLNKIQSVKVQLPRLPQDLLREIKEKDVDFAAHLVEPNVGFAILDFFGDLGIPFALTWVVISENISEYSGRPQLAFWPGKVISLVSKISSLEDFQINPVDVE